MGDASDVERITSMGLRVLFSSCWYLDYINYGQDWDKYYRCEQMCKYQIDICLAYEMVSISKEPSHISNHLHRMGITLYLFFEGGGHPP